MLKLKIEINQDSEEHIDVKMKTPKDVSKNTEQEKATARYIVEKLEELFNGKKEED